MTPTNRLADQSSPYLLQHADNPVAWHPWGPRALDEARERDCPILLSIGYSSCHWCHVMEHESFSDADTAAIQNEHFVSIKVDREERPDLDAIYMRAVQALTGSGGWPLTVFLTPDGRPFHGGTYFPPEPRHGMPSFRQLLHAVERAWHERRDRVESAADELLAMLERASTGNAAAPRDSAESVDPAVDLDGEDDAGGLPDPGRAVARMLATFDRTHGGFGSAPKFPQPMTLEALLAHASAERDPAYAEPALHTLRRMAAGGIRDHLAGGFHRYATDARWLVPHFEKMLYDNALLARAYLLGWKHSGADWLEREVRDTLGWLESEMRAPGGGFFAALDADSEGEEGRFYVWSADEIRTVLGEADASPDRIDEFIDAWGVRDGGNWDGTNILHRPDGSPSDDFGAERARLLEARSRRERPFRDTKILASWNGMALRAFAEAGAALERDEWVALAAGDLDVLLGALRDDDGRLRHQIVDGRASIPAFLDDVAALGLAALAVHEATLESRWLDESVRLASELLERFVDPDTDRLMDTPADGERLIVRPRETMDNAVPAGNSLAAELLFRLGRILGREAWVRRARGVVAAEAGAVESAPQGFGRLLALAIDLRAAPEEVAITGPPGDPRTRALLARVHRTPAAGRVVAGGEPEGALSASPLMKGRGPVDGAPAAWVCRNYACRAPVTDPDELGRALDRRD